MRIRACYLTIMLVMVASTGMATPPDGAGPNALLPRPAALEPQVRFWRSIFTEYSTYQVVLHDAWYIDKVYKVLDFRPYLDDGMSRGEVERLQKIETEVELDRIRSTLLRLHSLGPDPVSLTAEERAIWDLYRDIDAPDRFRAATDEKRLRSQRGLRERFAEGIRVSRTYLPEMERIFRAEGLPVELTRLPLIESCFNLRAYSKVGAAGIWQFMPATARQYIRVDNLVDERRDPIASTRAAAEFLSRMYDSLGAWPLAITAYNHGPEGIARAVREAGTRDIATIIREYRGRSFGFASRNFYPEFLAALDVERNYRNHFGDLPFEAPAPTHEYRLDRPVGIEVAARLAGTDREELAELNPALSSTIVGGRRLIPAGYRLRIPAEAADDMAAGIVRVAAVERPAPTVHKASRGARAKTGKRTVVTHRVRRGQTLSHIAKQHRVTVASLRTTNRLGRSASLRPGQVLRIPVPQAAM